SWRRSARIMLSSRKIMWSKKYGLKMRLLLNCVRSWRKNIILPEWLPGGADLKPATYGQYWIKCCKVALNDAKGWLITVITAVSQPFVIAATRAEAVIAI